MSNVARGSIRKIWTNETKVGNTYTIDLDDGNKYGCYKNDPSKKGIQEGDSVEFEYSSNGKFNNIEMKTLKKVASAGPPANSGSAPAASRNYLPEIDRQSIISKQAARNAAINYMSLLKDVEALPIPASAKGGKRTEIVDTLLGKYTQEFFEYSMGITADASGDPRWDEDEVPLPLDGEWE